MLSGQGGRPWWSGQRRRGQLRGWSRQRGWASLARPVDVGPIGVARGVVLLLVRARVFGLT
eukprot:316074-Alexandrium_andersonii.AAC.1